MFITRETDYALRILRTLSEGELFTAGDLAERESLPQNFTYRILKKLEKAGIILITRGSNGGCLLKVDLNTISLYDLIEAVEKNAFFTTCMRDGYQCEWRQKNGKVCNIHCQLKKIQTNIDKQLKECTLQSILFGDE